MRNEAMKVSADFAISCAPQHEMLCVLRPGVMSMKALHSSNAQKSEKRLFFVNAIVPSVWNASSATQLWRPNDVTRAGRLNRETSNTDESSQ
ncbi:MAG: hypothetical protein INR62_06865 [Rhodospirillales bacterium]|nr:hypothetical protein [Acetobacter sp.]